MVSRIPAATAEPITPATLGPMACIKRKLLGSAFCPSDWLTRAAIGTADTPAEPISGLIFSLEKRFMNLARSTPPAVPIPKASAVCLLSQLASLERDHTPIRKNNLLFYNIHLIKISFTGTFCTQISYRPLNVVQRYNFFLRRNSHIPL